MNLQELMTIYVAIEPPLSAGSTPNGEVRLLSFKDGTFEGSAGRDLRGTILPGGTDWQRVRADGTLEIRAHYLLESSAGERIEVDSRGIRHAAPEVLERLARGELVDPSQYYFRTAIRFNCSAPRLAYLNQLLAVSFGERMKDSVKLRVYAVP